MKRDKFLKSVALAGVSALFIPKAVKSMAQINGGFHNEGESIHDIETPSEFNIENALHYKDYKEWSDKHFSDKVKSFKGYLFELGDHDENGLFMKGTPDLHAQYIHVQVFAEEISEEHVKQFCEKVNHYADIGLIEGYKVTDGVIATEIFNKYHLKGKQSYLLSFYPFSRYNSEELAEKGWFTQEGIIDPNHRL